MFEKVDKAPPDAILGITDAFNADPNPDKINLSVGVYKDGAGRTPVLASVKAAEARVLSEEKTKSYRPISGAPEYGQAVQHLMFGRDHEVVGEKRAVTAQTPGGTGALRVAADYLHQNHPKATVWLPDPSWENHKQIFAAAGVKTQTYAYFDRNANGLALKEMLSALGRVPTGDVVLLHGCCHNPSGVDPLPSEWNQIGNTLAERKLLPLVDFAYQGFGNGLSEDADGLLELARPGAELLICSSFSKNFGLYSERVGALTAVAGSAKEADAVFSQIKRVIRANYSNPPAHGASIVTTILGDAQLRQQWENELAEMRDRINGMRWLFVAALDARGVKLPGGDNSFITRQKGMFSFSGLNAEQVERLKKEFSIYIVGSGRINVAGMSESTMDRLCDAIKAVL